MSKNLSKIPTIRHQNRISCRSIPPCLMCCNTSFPYSRAYRPMPRAVCRTLPFFLQLLDVSRSERVKLRGALDDMRGSMGKKHYNAGNRAGYSASLDVAGMAALNPRCGGNGTLLLNVSRRTRGGALGLLSIPPSLPRCNASFPYSRT